MREACVAPPPTALLPDPAKFLYRDISDITQLSKLGHLCIVCLVTKQALKVALQEAWSTTPLIGRQQATPLVAEAAARPGAEQRPAASLLTRCVLQSGGGA